VRPEQHYLIVDDFVGQGGTLAPNEMQIQALRDKYGQEFEEWWRQRFGFGFAELTRSEARYLENSPDAHTIRDRLVAAGLEGSSPSSSAPHAPIAPRTEPD
jgi:hypothetical protein